VIFLGISLEEVDGNLDI